MENNTISQKIIKNRVGTIDGLSFNLYKNDSIVDGRTTLTTGGYMTQLEYYKSSAYKQHLLDSIFIKNAKDLKLYKETNPSILNREVLQNGFIIYPRETKYFSSIVNLPLRKNGVNWISDINKSKPNLASFSLVNIAENTKKYMSENQKKELEENGYSLFNGVLQSNKVPVKMVSMPK